MSERRASISLRGLLVGMGVIAIAYVSALTVQVVVLLRPAAQSLSGATSDILLDHDQSMERVQRSLYARRMAVLHVVATPPPAPIEPSLDSIRRIVTRLIEEASASRASIERADIPLQMRLELAQAVARETQAAVLVSDAIRYIENGTMPPAVLALRAANAATDSATFHLSEAQRTAMLEVLGRQERLLGRLETLERWSQAWVVLGLLLLASGVLLVRRRFYLPIRALERGVQRIIAGDLNTEIPVRSGDELGLLASHVNDMTGVLRDRAAEETRARESLTERFGRVLDESSSEIGVFDAQTLTVLQANRGLCVALGYTPSEIARLRLDDLIAGLEDARLATILAQLRASPQDRALLTIWLRRHDGSIRPAEVALQYSAGGDTPVFILVSEDAGVRQRVRELDTRLRTFAAEEAEALGSGEMGRAMQALTRFVATALEAERCTAWQAVQDEMRPVTQYDATAAAHTARPGRHPREEMAGTGAHKVSITSAGREIGALVVEAGDANRRWTAEETAFLASAADLASRAFDAQERRGLEQALERAQRMDSIGQLAGGVAHDFNNILTAILGNLEACRSELETGSSMDEALAEAEQAALRAADLTKQLLTFARRQVVETMAVDVAARARDAESMLRRLIGPEITLSFALDPELGNVRLGAGQLEQLLVNLIVNARDAMPEGGTITIRGARRTIGSTPPADFPSLTAGKYVELAVTDTGMGMDAKTVERVFEPFFTTKRVGEGTGLGLAVCYGIVRNAGGAIAVQSTPGKGSTFRIVLPSGGRGSPAAGRRQLAEPTGATVLLAEDESAIRTLLLRMLTARGYRVHAAVNGHDALAMAERLDAPVDALLTDVVMPEMGGVELARAMRKRLPGLPVLFMSGYTANAAIQSGELEDSGFIAKPFTPDDLIRKLEELLDAAREREDATAL